MEVKSISECLNRKDNMKFDKSLKDVVKDDLEVIEDIRGHIKWVDDDVVIKGEYAEE